MRCIMSENSEALVARQIKVLRQNLLDLTMRNQLLNFKPRSMTIKVIEGSPSQIYNRLIIRSRKKKTHMQFLPSESEPVHEEQGKPENEYSEDLESSLLWESPKTPHPDLKRRERYLPTNLNSKELQRRLFYINQRARSVMEEQGYNILYLALGFLKWKENSDSDFRKAPLILIPVELERKKVKGFFKLIWTGEDIITNISLQAKLMEQGIELPEFNMPTSEEGVKEYLSLIRKLISSEKEWSVLEEVFLGFFSFTKFVMYKDLEPESWPPDLPLEKNPLIKAIFDPAEEETYQGFIEEEVDLKIPSHQVYHVLDADSSQISVMEDVKNKIDLVVEGPPGTGKSQTIVNLIAELMVKGNTILFVSEKMAALEVVKSRLDAVGLGEFCLELHSRKSNKKEVLHELESTLRKVAPPHIPLEDDMDEIENLKSELNHYVNLLHAPYGKIKWTPFQLYGLKENSIYYFESLGLQMPRISIENPENCTLKEWQLANSKVKELAELYKLVKPISKNPWRLSRPDPILPAEEEEIRYLLDKSLQTLKKLRSKLETMHEISGIPLTVTLEELEHVIDAVDIISSFPSLERELILNPRWDYQKDAVYELIKNLEEYDKFKPVLREFNKDMLEFDLVSLLNEFEQHQEKFLKFLSSDYKKLKKKIGQLYLKNPPDDDDKILNDLRTLIKYQKLKKRIIEEDSLARTLFGSHWKSEDSNPDNLREIAEWILKFRKALKKGQISEKVLIILDSSKQEPIKQLNSQISQIFKTLLDLLSQLNKYLHFTQKSPLGRDIKTKLLSDIESYIAGLNIAIPQLQSWSRFNVTRKETLDTLAQDLVFLLEKDNIRPEDMIPCLEGNFADALLRNLFLNPTPLSYFIGDVHENKIKEFQELDKKIISLNRFRIAEKLYKSRPSLNTNATPRSELGVLKSEFSRKRGHMPIRRLLSICGSLIQKIKPCFMMSPLSIAQYLDPHSVKNLRFDYVIFDEASQVKPEDALGALLRAKNAVIMGDTKQLPPTTFFDILLNVDAEDYDISVVADMESILHLCKRSFPSKMLRWHYRSRHESLIAVSNQEFYDNHLLVYPSPAQDSEDLGLKFVHLPDTIYDRGKTATNPLEAKEVVKEAFKHYKRYGNSKSLGIGTFNVRQQQAILEELELQLKLNPDMEEYFYGNQEEHFFVKNLETIQGDERDVILVSIGYGFDDEGRLTLNFGPLNQEGGERRLNVLISRAREKCVVFSNFRGKDLKLRDDSPFGLRALKVFLDYAENRKLVSKDIMSSSPSSPLEDAIHSFLTKEGFEVHRQVGCAGFRIELAVVDPEFPEKYLLGISTDGGIYKNTPVARDRDRLQEQILTGLGWQLYRVWSTDWYRNREKVKNNILETIEKLLDKNRRYEELEEPMPIEYDQTDYEEVIPDEPDDYESGFNNVLDEIPEYVLTPLDMDISQELHKEPVGKIAQAIFKIVEFEGPIHYSEVLRRIRTYWGLSRAGRRVQAVINEALNLAVQDGRIFEKDNFYFFKDSKILVRRRTGNPPAKMDLISEEEISEAIRMVLNIQYATAQEELIKEVSRIFGMKITRKPAAKRIGRVIDQLISVGEIEKRTDGMIDIRREN